MRDNLFEAKHSCCRTRRGDMAPLMLKILLEKPMHGYQIISKLEEKSYGMWRPSAGSIYPNLQMLEEQELVTSAQKDGKRVYTLTDKGVQRAQQVQEDLKKRFAGHEQHIKSLRPLKSASHDLMSNIRQVAMLGSETASHQANKILVEANQKLIKLIEKNGEKTD